MKLFNPMVGFIFSGGMHSFSRNCALACSRKVCGSPCLMRANMKGEDWETDKKGENTVFPEFSSPRRIIFVSFFLT